MPKTKEHYIHDRLSAMPQAGLAAVKELLWTDLNYDYANAPISVRPWPEGAQHLLAGDPLLLAQHGDFHVIYTPLAAGLTAAAERHIVAHLLPNQRMTYADAGDMDNTRPQIAILEQAFRRPLNRASLQKALRTIRSRRLTGAALVTALTELYHLHGLNVLRDRPARQPESEDDDAPRVVCSEGLVG